MGEPGGNRTHIRRADNILSVARIPIPPLAQSFFVCFFLDASALNYDNLGTTLSSSQADYLYCYHLYDLTQAVLCHLLIFCTSHILHIEDF